MLKDYHQFMIPVMGTGHSIDTPIRVAPFGITSVISLVDDMLIEKIRRYYCEKYDFSYEPIGLHDHDRRARRITEYLNTVHRIVNLKIEQIKSLPFFEDNDKTKYFEMLPESSPVRCLYDKFAAMKDSIHVADIAEQLNDLIKPGSIDVNLMLKVDRPRFLRSGEKLSDEYNDLKAAFRGFANSVLESSVVFSAGINQNLYDYITRFKEFYRENGEAMKKRVILKVSDFRSALLQGKFLARKGVEVYEYRVESGLNCGGHAFSSQGRLLPTVLKEFRQKRDQLVEHCMPLVKKFYDKMGWEHPGEPVPTTPRLSVQGGFGNHGECMRVAEDYGVDYVGFASPFLLVPEATPVDAATRQQLVRADAEDLYLSAVSPLGIPFNNLKNSASERYTKKRIESGQPGSPCPKGYAALNYEYSEEKPLCTASAEYQKKKLSDLESSELDPLEKEKQRAAVLARSCICNHLGNGALVHLGLGKAEQFPTAICPGPNLAFFNRLYSLREMVDHIYGRIHSLVPADRPHVFANELRINLDYLRKMILGESPAMGNHKLIQTYFQNLRDSITHLKELAKKTPYAGENFATLSREIEQGEQELEKLAQMAAVEV